MTRFIEWLLGLDGIRLARDAPLILQWERQVEAWMLVGMALVAVAWIAMVYRKEPTGAGRRAALAGVRCTIIALVVVLFCRPVLVLQRNRVEPSHVALLLDTSQSMGAADSYHDSALASTVARGAGLLNPDELRRHSRFELIRRALLSDDGVAPRRLLERNGVQLVTFDNVVQMRGFFRTAEPESVSALTDQLRSLRPDGAATDVPGAILHVLEKNRGRRLAAIILAGDGQSTQPTSLKDALDAAAGRQIPIFPLRIGDPRRPQDLEVVSVNAPTAAFVHDLLSVEAVIRATALTGPTTIQVRLVDEQTGRAVNTREIVLQPQAEAQLNSAQPESRDDQPVQVEVRLSTKPERIGLARYRIDVSPLEGELVLENNVQRVDVTIMEDHLRVLYVEGYPRYEYRYLKNALLREPTVSLSVLLLQADDPFVQEGTDPIRRFPQTPQELNRYDVVLLGDVDPRGGWLSDAQARMLLDWVGNHGGGFGLIAGARAAPHRFLGTVLEKLLPIRIDPAFQGVDDRPIRSGFRLRWTDDGRRSNLFLIAAGEEGPECQGDLCDTLGTALEQSDRIWESLPQLYWIAATLGPRSGAQVLAQHPTLRTATGPLPLIVLGRYGAGKLFFQASDDTWLWRRHTGELLHDTYWVRVVRELMPEKHAVRDRRYVLRTDRRVYEYGAPVRAQLEFFDAELLGEQSDRISMKMLPPDSEVTHARRAGRGAKMIFALHRLGPESNRFEGSTVPDQPGSYLLTAAGLPPRAGEREVSAAILVQRPDLEARRPEADHEALDRIASATGGRVLDLDQLEKEFATIRDRSVQIPDDLTEPLWDSKLALMLFVVLISIEWVVRKACGLL